MKIMLSRSAGGSASSSWGDPDTEALDPEQPATSRAAEHARITRTILLTKTSYSYSFARRPLYQKALPTSFWHSSRFGSLLRLVRAHSAVHAIAATSSVALVNNPTESTVSAASAPGGGTSRKTAQSTIRVSEMPVQAR